MKANHPLNAPTRKTKIIATLGPATSSLEMLGRLIKAGMNVARLNMSHGSHDWVRRVVKDLRAAATEHHCFVGILMDTQGPAIRTGDLPAALNLKPGEKFTLTVRGAKCVEAHSVDVNYDNLVNDISVDDVVLVDNGAIRMKVLDKSANRIECEVLTQGTLRSRRHINLPGVRVNLPALTAKDLADVELGLELGVDFIALSFTREAADVAKLRSIVERVRPCPLIIAKIEDQEAVKNFDAIVREADAIMIARGDLGIEVPYEELPMIQRHIVETCLRVGRPVIVATHMLESMIENPMPTRAEITDVANAVFEQADAIMLSGETTTGKYPVQCVETFDRIARRVERDAPPLRRDESVITSDRQSLVKSAVILADEIHADGIVILTIRGHVPRHAAWMRPRHSPIFAVCESWAVADSLALHFAVTPLVPKFHHGEPERTVQNALTILRERKLLAPGSTVVVLSSISAADTMVDAVQLRTV